MLHDLNRTHVDRFITERNVYFKFGLFLPVLLQGFHGTVGTLEARKEKSPYNWLSIESHFDLSKKSKLQFITKQSH